MNRSWNRQKAISTEIAFLISNSVSRRKCGEDSWRKHDNLALDLLSKLRNGFFLTYDDLTASYVIIRHNIRTYRSDGVVAVIMSKQNAEAQLKKFEDFQDSSDRHEGWRYFIEKANLKAGANPAEATQQRQDQLEERELKAMQETDPPDSSSLRRQR
jgi:hypothetical protein